MRIIAGTHRSRRLLGPPDRSVTRPMIDRVKESLFNQLAAADRFDGAVVLDLFAGTGSLGLECLSRGATHVTFVEQDRDAESLLKKNIATLGEQAATAIIRVDALGTAMTRALSRHDYTLCFADPPYALIRNAASAPCLWRQIESISDVCAAGAVLVLRLESSHTSPPFTQWVRTDSRRYGSMALHLHRKSG